MQTFLFSRTELVLGGCWTFFGLGLPSPQKLGLESILTNSLQLLPMEALSCSHPGDRRSLKMPVSQV